MVAGAPSLEGFLRALSADAFRARLETGCEVARTCHGFYANEISPAVKFIHHIRDGARSVLVGSPMQSGKTNIMGCIMVLCRELARGAPDRFKPRGVYICANNQIDFRSQSMSSLCHHMQVLTLRDRRRWVDTSDTPLIVFYDESHFGDGVRMTINDFLKRHNIFGARRNMVFCGVSATPWSAMGRLDAEIFADAGELEAGSYNSVGMMLERGRIQEADLLFVNEDGEKLSSAASNDPYKIHVNQRSQAFRHIERIMVQDEVDGYCVVRCLKHQGKKLLRMLAEIYGDRIYGVEWNQHQREFTADFFKERRYGKLTVVVVQHKARMGNRIDTRYIHFFHEHSPNAHVDTMAQSFIGRACGFGKQDHKCMVYSERAVAEIYDACMGRQPDMHRYHLLCELHRKKPGIRAELIQQPKGYKIVELETVKFSRGKNFPRTAIREINALRKRHINLLRGSGKLRQMSRWKNPRSWLVPSRINSCDPSPGSYAVTVHDGKWVGPKGEEKIVLSETIQVTLWVRSQELELGFEPGIQPKENSLFYNLSRRAPAEPAAPARPADSDLEDNVAAASEPVPRSPRWLPAAQRPPLRRVMARTGGKK